MIDHWRQAGTESETLRGGRHRMTREEVHDSQRYRLRRAVLDEVGTVGGANITVTGVVERAKVSKKTFYEHFSGLDECLLEAIEAANEMLRRDVLLAASAASDGGEFAELRAAVREYLIVCADDPALNIALLTGWVSRRAVATDRWTTYQDFLENFVMVGHRAARQRDPGIGEVDPENVVAALGYLRYSAIRKLISGEHESLREDADRISGKFLSILVG